MGRAQGLAPVRPLPARQTPMHGQPPAARLSRVAAPFAVARPDRCRDARRWSRSSNSREVRQGSASNHPRSCAATASSGSGHRRQYWVTFFLGLLVGRTSPTCHDVRSPTRNCASVGALGGDASPLTGRSAIATSWRWARRISLNSRTGSKVACKALTRYRTASLVRGSASNR